MDGGAFAAAEPGQNVVDRPEPGPRLGILIELGGSTATRTSTVAKWPKYENQVEHVQLPNAGPDGPDLDFDWKFWSRLAPKDIG
jgi:hypothetical protein